MRTSETKTRRTSPAGHSPAPSFAASPLAEYKSPEVLLKGPLHHVFKSMPSFRWFERRNRAQLVQAGAVICPVGQNLYHEGKLIDIVLDVGAKRAVSAK